MLDSKDIDTINNSDIYDTYKDFYLSEKKREEKQLEGIPSTNGLKARVGAKKAVGTALTVTTQENVIKRTFDKRFVIPLYFDFFKHPVYSYGLKEDLIVRLELDTSKKVFYALEIPQQYKSFQTFRSNMMQYLTNLMPQP